MKIRDFYKQSDAAYKKQLPLVLFRLPEDDKLQLYIQNSSKLFEFNSEKQSGFVFAPFDLDYKSVILPTEECIYYSVRCLENETVNEVDKDNFGVSDETKEKQSHVELVNKAKHLISKQIADKIVVARQEIIEIQKVDVVELFSSIEQKYRNAFVYLWFHPKIGMWAGASPEKLFTLHRNTFETMALAGTQPWSGSDEINWAQKEKQEQKFVTDFILEALEDYVDLKFVSSPYTVKAGNLAHIRTDLIGEFNHKKNIFDLIDSLHPTPATCGLPKKIAKDFIIKNEAKSRAYYSGYMGKFDAKSSIFLYVNLRCANIVDKEATIYIGGGITAASDPEMEWEETKKKATTMKSVFK